MQDLKKGDIRKQEILNTAEQLFCRNGYEQTGIQDILDRLNISKGSFYHHYLSKEALLEEICRKRAEQIYSSAAAAAEAKETAVNKLNCLLSGMIPFRDEKLRFLLMLLPIFRLPEGRTVRMSYCDALSSFFYPSVCTQLQLGDREGELSCTDPDLTAEIMLSLVNRFWVFICDMILTAEQKGVQADLTECLRAADSYRRHIERMVFLPCGSIELVDIPTLGYMNEQIHSHWVR